MTQLVRAAILTIVTAAMLCLSERSGYSQVQGVCVACKYCTTTTGCPRSGCPGSCCSGGASRNTQPAGPTPEELKRAREKKDLKEAADDAVDKGVDFYKKGDWTAAISRFKEALDYDPDNDDAQHNLQQAVTKSRKAGEEFRQAQENSQKEMARIAAEQNVAEKRAQENSQIAAIVRSIKNIQVPPPILAEEAAITFGQIAPGDHSSKNIILGAEVGVAVADVFGKIGTSPLIGTKLIFAAGKTFIAAENGADVYLVKQNDTYEKALRYLKDDATRQDFTAIVRTIKEHRPISENASIEMVRAAQAILDPKLGNSGKRIAWDAMLSPEARNAALTQACIELGGEIIGQASEKIVARLMAQRMPAFTEATEYLSKARVALQRVEDPAAHASLKEAIKQANETITKTYHTVHPGSAGMEHVTSIFTKHKEEEFREKK